jgi:2,5-furandicarboxylate decarboxylase 1
VDPVGELGAVLHAAQQRECAVLFHRVKGHQMPVFAGGLGFAEGVGAALGCAPGEIGERMASAFHHPLPPILEDQPAAQEVILRDGIDLPVRFPVPTHAPEDAGPFITGGVAVTRDPASGRHNLSFNRMQLYGGADAGFSINEWRDVGTFLEASRGTHGPLPVCVAIGVDPVLQIAAACRYPGDEYEIAGALRGEPVPVVRALCSDVLIPANAEIVLECEVFPDERRVEGPMAEFTGHYSDATPKHVAHVRAVTHRRDPIFQTVAGGGREHVNLGNTLPREPLVRTAVERVCRRVRAVHLPPYAGGFLALVSLDRDHPGEVRNVGLAALTAHINIKVAIVVDTDVDIYNPADVFWAVCTRVRADQDILTVPRVQGHELDPTAADRGLLTKVVIDATLDPAQRQHFRKVVYPQVELEQYLQPARNRVLK